MRRAISSNVPVLTHAAPFAVAPSKHTGTNIAYTLRGQRGMFTGGLWLLISGLIFTPLFIWELIDSGPRSIIWISVLPIPVLLLPFLGLSTIAFGVMSLRKSAHDRQVVVDTANGIGQIQDDRGYVSTPSSASIHVQPLDILLAKRRLRVHAGSERVFATIITVQSDFEILGAFKSEETAGTFAQLLAKETGLAIEPPAHFPHTTVHGFWDLNPSRTDEHALNNRRKGRHLEPATIRKTS